MDFKNNLEEARTQINAWIENKTKGKRWKSSFSPLSPFSFSHIYIQWKAQILKREPRQLWQMNIRAQRLSVTLRGSSTPVLKQPLIWFYHQRSVLPILKSQTDGTLWCILFCALFFFSLSILFWGWFMYLDISVVIHFYGWEIFHRMNIPVCLSILFLMDI